MKLRTFSDYALRVLMQAALRRPETVTVEEVAATFGISRHHLVKVVHELGRSGFLATRRGVGGGFTLARPPEEIGLGAVVRLGEEGESVIDCRDAVDEVCRLFPACRLKGVLDEAASAFFAVLDRHTLADLMRRPKQMKTALGL